MRWNIVAVISEVTHPNELYWIDWNTTSRCQFASYGEKDGISIIED